VESVHNLAARPQFHDFVPHLDDIRKSHFIQPPGQS
jgi:hypothetical protein